MDRSIYERNLLLNRIPIFTASQIDEARFAPPLRPQQNNNVYIGPRPVVYPEISYGEVLPPAGTQYLLISYILPMDTSCVSCEKQTFTNIESAISLNSQAVASIEVPQELPMLPVDTVALEKRGVTLAPVTEQYVLARREICHSGKRMDMLKQRMLEELKARTKNEESASKNKSCIAKSKCKKISQKVPPIIIRLGKSNKVSETRPVTQTEDVASQLMKPVMEVKLPEYTCDFCGMAKKNKSLISEHIRRCKVRLQKLEKAFEREMSPAPRATLNTIDVYLRCMRHSI